MNKIMNRIRAAAGAVAHTAASAVVLCLFAVGLAPQAQAEYCEHCITFSADKPFGIRMVKGTGVNKQYSTPTVTLEYSTDQSTWKTFNPDTDYKAGADHKFYLRGKNNTTFSSSSSLLFSNVFTNTPDSVATAISCSGNIETLLDYTKVAAGQHPSMDEYAFCFLFSGFAALTAAPKLPATTLTSYCYCGMFKACTSLTTAPDLPAKTLAQSCYNGMFEDCTSLTTAPNLPATTLAESCYNGMFRDCTSLTTAPDLPVMTLAPHCYRGMFRYCTSLTAAPNLPATTLASSCYSGMFNGCISLTAAPDLPATTLASNGYSSMFNGCISLTTLPVLNVHTVTNSSCFYMFFACSNLVVNTEGPGVEWSIPSDVVVPSTAGSTAKSYWATNMFANTAGTIANSSVVTPGKKYYVASAPVALNVTAVEGATFQAYTNGAPVDVPCTIDYLTQVSVVYTATNGFMFGESGYRTFSTNLTASASETTVTLAKDQWPIAAKACTNCITFSAEDDFGIKMWKNSNPSVNPSLEYSTDKTYWATFDKEQGAAAGADHKLYLRGTGNTAFASCSTFIRYYVFTNTAESAATAIACSGNIETLLDYKTVAAGNHPVMGQYAFYNLFKCFAALTTAPALPAMTLAKHCYVFMFSGCSSLKVAPELPATNLAESCYYFMFSDCSSLKVAPELPATNLAEKCCFYMFNNCRSLTTPPPVLPATNLTAYCYNSMFAYCTSLTAVPELPATNLASNCYGYMFCGCTSLIVNTNAPGKAWALPAEAAASAASATGWNTEMFKGTPGNVTNTMVTCGTPYYVASVPVPIPFSVTAPAGAEAKVYTNAVDAANYVPAGGTVWSYRDAFVVYTVTEPGKYFENGQTAITNRLDTKAVTATDTSAYVPKTLGTPSVQLGVVAQRYPWNGTLDVQYKTPYYCGLVTFKANDTVIGTAPGTGGEVKTASIDLNAAADGAFKGKALKNVKITATIE